jgi:tetratricopeptide (TPR) repeat protein
MLLAILLSHAPVAAETHKSDAFAGIRDQISRHNYDQAESSLWAIISREPQNKQALFLLGKIRLEQNRLPEAAALFRRVIQIDSSDEQAVQELCSVLLLQDSPDQAFEIVQNAITKHPSNFSLQVQLARVYVAQKKYSEAAATLHSLPPRELRGTTVPLQAAVLLGSGDRAAARALVSKLPVDSEMRLDLANVFIDFNELSSARDVLARVPPKSKASDRYLYLMGITEGKLGNSEAANGFLQQALKANPKSLDSLLALGEIAASRKQYTDAINFFERAHTIDPESRRAYRDLIQVAIDSRSYALAQRYALELEKKGSTSKDLYFSAAALLQSRDSEAAERTFRKYLDIDAHDAKAHMGLGIALLNQEHVAEAKSELEQALALDPKLADAEYFLGVIALQKDDSEAARQHFEHVIIAQPKHSSALFNLGLISFRAGELERARQYWESSETSDPSNPEVHYQLSLLYNRLGLKEQAQAQLERFRTLKPSIQPKGGFPDQPH